MATANLSAGDGALPGSNTQTGYTPPLGGRTSSASQLPLRDGHISIADLIALYMQHYAGRDPSRVQRLEWWAAPIGGIPLNELTDDEVHSSLELLASQPTANARSASPRGDEPVRRGRR